MTDRSNVLLAVYTKWAFAFFLLSQLFFNYTIVSQIGIVGMCGMVALTCLTKMKVYFNVYFIFGLLLILQSYIFSVNGISISTQTSLEMTGTLVINLIAAWAMYNYILSYDNFEESIDLFAKIGILFTVFIVIFSILSGTITGTRLGGGIYLVILSRNVVYSANTLALIAGFSYLIYLYKYNTTKNNFLFIPMSWLILITLLTGSRKGLIILGIGTLLLLFLASPGKKIRNIMISAVIILGLYELVVNVPFIYDIMGNRVESLVTAVLGTGTGDASTDSRSSYIEIGWRYFLMNPWRGYGLDTFRHLSDAFGTYSHNNYIELLFSGGIPALVFYYGFRVYILIKLFIERSINKVNPFLFVTLLTTMLLEYAIVSYFERLFVILFIFILSGYELYKKPNVSKINSLTPVSDKII